MITGRRLAAVTLNWHDTESTLRCVASLLAQDTSLHVYVVDNESDGGLASAVDRSFGSAVTVIEVAENRGFAGGINLGLRRALDEGAWAILAINNDAFAEPNAVGLMAQQLFDARTGVVGPRILNSDGSLQSTGCKLKAWGARTEESGPHGRVDFFTWACVLLRSEMLDQIGLLDESFFMYWEDADFGLRVRNAGWELSLASQAHVIHELSASHERAGVRIGFYSTLGLQRMAQIHGGAWKWWVPYRVLGRFFNAIRQGRIDYARAVLGGARMGRSDIRTAYKVLGSTSWPPRPDEYVGLER